MVMVLSSIHYSSLSGCIEQQLAVCCSNSWADIERASHALGLWIGVSKGMECVETFAAKASSHLWQAHSLQLPGL